MADTTPTNTDENAREGEDLIRPLPEDNSTPFSPPTDPIEDTAADLDDRLRRGRLDDTHPETDAATDIDSDEYYDEGLSGAVEAEEPNADNAVVDYDREKDQRRQQDRDAA